MASTARILHEEVLPGGEAWSWRVQRHQRLRLTDVAGGGNFCCLFFHARQPLERYNMPDTLKAQHTAHLTAGRCLFSDMGRVLLSIVADELGWHDPLGAYSDAAQVAARFATRSYQAARNDRHRNARDNLLVELGKHGLDGRDWHAPVNFFTRIAADGEGRLRHVAGHSRPGASVTLRAELDVLVVATAVPHPLDAETAWRPRPIALQISAGAPPAADDPCRLSRPECGRAYALSEQTALSY
jgi:uncharacterized protein